MSNHDSDFAAAVRTARHWLAREPLFLDSETTDLYGQVCELAILRVDGRALYSSLIKPTIPISREAWAVHHISQEMVEHAPGFGDVDGALRAVLHDKLVVIYNAEFDVSVLDNSARACGVPPLVFAPVCAMQLYAQFFGERNHRHGGYKWQRLEAAAQQCRITVPAGLHRARADAELCRQIVLHMAAQEIGEAETPSDSLPAQA